MLSMEIPIEVESPGEMPYPPGDVPEIEMRQYTQGGFYNVRELSISTDSAMDYLCSLEGIQMTYLKCLTETSKGPIVLRQY